MFSSSGLLILKVIFYIAVKAFLTGNYIKGNMFMHIAPSDLL